MKEKERFRARIFLLNDYNCGGNSDSADEYGFVRIDAYNGKLKSAVLLSETCRYASLK